MKIYIPNISSQKIGGGWTFLRNFQKAMSLVEGVEIVSTEDDYDILFAFAPTTVSGEAIERAKQVGKPFVLRLDGVPEDSRNEGKGTRRLVEYALKADHIVYQTCFVQNTLGRMLRNLGVTNPESVIYNGVDTEVFTPDGPKMPLPGKLKILNVHYRKDNNKRFEETVAMYRELWSYRKDTNLVLMGRYPTEWQDYGFGFFAGERISRYGVIEDNAQKAMIMRTCDFLFFPSFADPSPNTVLEAMSCGLPVIYNRYGGVAELVQEAGFPIDSMISFKGYASYGECITLFEDAINNLNLKEVARKRAAQFDLVSMGNNYKTLFERIQKT